MVSIPARPTKYPAHSGSGEPDDGHPLQYTSRRGELYYTALSLHCHSGGSKAGALWRLRIRQESERHDQAISRH